MLDNDINNWIHYYAYTFIIPVAKGEEECLFLRQIVLQKGIPFEMKLPKTAPLTYGSLTKEQFDKEIEKGMSDVKAGRVYSADAIEAEMKRDFGI